MVTDYITIFSKKLRKIQFLNCISPWLWSTPIIILPGVIKSQFYSALPNLKHMDVIFVGANVYGVEPFRQYSFQEPFYRLDGVLGSYSSDGMIRYRFELDKIMRSRADLYNPRWR
jgi:hypothetical protein